MQYIHARLNVFDFQNLIRKICYLIHINCKWLKAGNTNINSNVKFVARYKKRINNVALNHHRTIIAQVF